MTTLESLNKTIQKMMQGRNVASSMDQVMKQVYQDPEVITNIVKV